MLKYNKSNHPIQNPFYKSPVHVTILFPIHHTKSFSHFARYSYIISTVGRTFLCKLRTDELVRGTIITVREDGKNKGDDNRTVTKYFGASLTIKGKDIPVTGHGGP
jgi:hypothetical protein